MAYCACSNARTGASGTAQGGSPNTSGDTTAQAMAGQGTSNGGSGGAPDDRAEAGQTGEAEPDANVGGATTEAASGGSSSEGGGDPSIGSCTNPDTECGGDIAGTWAISLICVDVQSVPSGPLAGCEGIGYRLASDSTLTLATDQTYQEATSGTSFGVIFEVPQTCATGGSCEGVAPVLSIKNATVETNGGLCTITGSLANEPNTHSGTYTVNGNTLVLDGKTNAPMTFCVKGDTLVLRAVQERQILLETFTRK